MALTIDWKEVRPIFRGSEYPDSVQVNGPVDPGTVVSPTGTGELYAPGNGDGWLLAIGRALSARRVVAAIRTDEVELGSGIQGLAQGAGIFATSGGVLTDVATGNKRVGTIRVVNGRRIARLEG